MGDNMTKLKRESFEKFYLFQRNNLIFEINRRVNNMAESEEIFHRGILKYLEEYSKWHGINELTYEYAMRICISIISEIECEKEIISDRCEVVQDPYETVILKDKVGFLIDVIDNLRTYNSVLKLYLIENYSVCEIAKQLGMKPNTVSKHIHRGLIKLNEEIRKSKYFRF